MEILLSSFITDGNVKWYSHFLNEFGIPKKLKLPIDNSDFRYIHKRPENQCCSYTQMAALFIITKKNEWIHAITLYWVKEVSHRRLLIVWLNFYEVSKTGNSVHRKWISGCQRVGEGAVRRRLLKSTGFALGSEENVLKLNSGMVTQSCEHTKNHWLVYFKRTLDTFKVSERWLLLVWNSTYELKYWENGNWG